MPVKYVDLMVDVLELMEELSSRSVEMKNLLKESLTESEIKDLCSIMIDIESGKFNPQSKFGKKQFLFFFIIRRLTLARKIPKFIL